MWPVGAVSNMTTSKAISSPDGTSKKSVKRSKAATSDVQGPLICSSMTSTIWGGKAARMGSIARSMYSWVALSASISIAHRLGKPWIGITWWPISCSKTSARFEAGSVVTIRVFLPSSARRTAWVQAMEVFPTPPLPEKNMYFVSMLFLSIQVFLNLCQFWVFARGNNLSLNNNNRQRCHLLFAHQSHYFRLVQIDLRVA